MSTYKATKGKIVALGGIRLEVAGDGSLRIFVAANQRFQLPGRELIVEETEASQLHDLMGDVMEWESSHSTTENTINRAIEQADAQSGKLEDERAYEGR